MKTITTIEEFQNFISQNKTALIYFSTPQCNICKVLKPKIIDLIKKQFPNIKLGYINSFEQKEIAAQNRIFTVPSILASFMLNLLQISITGPYFIINAILSPFSFKYYFLITLIKIIKKSRPIYQNNL